MNANEIYNSAVTQCNVIENSLEGCLQVLQKICVQKPSNSSNSDTQPTFNLCGKPSYVVCNGNRVNGQPNVTAEIVVEEDVASPNIEYLFECTQLKLQSIIDRQRHIVQLVDNMEQKLLLFHKDHLEKESTSESEEYVDCKTHMEAPCN